MKAFQKAAGVDNMYFIDFFIKSAAAFGNLLI
jgi:hypothetical protein